MPINLRKESFSIKPVLDNSLHRPPWNAFAWDGDYGMRSRQPGKQHLKERGSVMYPISLAYLINFLIRVRRLVRPFVRGLARSATNMVRNQSFYSPAEATLAKDSALATFNRSRSTTYNIILNTQRTTIITSKSHKLPLNVRTH